MLENPDQPTGTAGTDARQLAPDTGKPFTTTRMLRFSAGFVAMGVMWTVGLSIISSVLLPQRLIDIGSASPEAALGTVNAISAVVSLVSNLLFGNLSDRTRWRFGRRGPFVLVGALITAGGYLLVGTFNSVTGVTFAYSLGMVGINMMIAPGIAVLADRVPLQRRGTMSSFYAVGVTAGFPIGAMVGARFITNPMPGLVLAAALAALAGIIAFSVWPRERPANELPAADAGSFRDLLVSFRPPRPSTAPDFYKAFVGRFLMLISYQMIFAYQLYILQNYIGQTTEESGATIATMSLVALAVSLIGAAVGGPVSDLIGRRKIPVIVASVLFAVGIAMPWVLPTTTGMLLFAGIAGMGFALYTSVDQALNVDVLPNKENAGKDLAILNLATTLGQMVGPLITSAIVVATGSYQFIFPISIAAALLGGVSIWLIKGVK